MPSESREFRAEPVNEITPKERRTVERITLTASDWVSVLRKLLMPNAPFTRGRLPYTRHLVPS